MIADVGSLEDHPSLAAGEVEQLLVVGRLSGGLDGVLVAGFDDAGEEGMVRLHAQGVLDALD